MNRRMLGSITLFFAVILSIFGLNSNGENKNMSDITMANIDALASNESDKVTCVSDKGDTCVVGNTINKDYDEGCASWFWG